MRSCTVLVVEDSPEDRETYRRFLAAHAECSYRVLEARGGEEALRMDREAHPDCVLLDYRLPDKDGLEVLQHLIATARGEPRAIIMLTGGGHQIGIQALKAGALDYLDKNGINAEQLHRSIQYALKKAELRREVERQRRWLQGTLNSIGEAVIASDGSGSLVFMNPIAEALLGCRADEMRGKRVEEICSIVNEHTRRWVGGSFIGMVFRSRIEAEERVLLLTQDGRELPIEYSVAPIRGDRDEIMGGVVSVRDITRRREIEASLKEREERLSLITRVAGDAIWDWDLSTDYVWSNDAYEALFGRPPPAAGARAPWRLDRIHPADRARISAETDAALAGTGASWALNFRCRTLDGSYIDCLERAVIVRDAVGRPARVLASMLRLSDIAPPTAGEGAGAPDGPIAATARGA